MKIHRVVVTGNFEIELSREEADDLVEQLSFIRDFDGAAGRLFRGLAFLQEHCLEEGGDQTVSNT